MTARKGIRLSLSPARKVVLELLHHARKVPSLPLAKQLDVGSVIDARQRFAARSWTAIFLKAYALVAQRNPALRRALIAWPWPHLYQHSVSEAAVLVERCWQGEQVVLGARLRAPEDRALTSIDDQLRWFREAPVWEISAFRQLLRLGRLPWPLRRFTFWQSLYLSGYRRAKRFGTFMISSLGNLGVEQCHPLTPLTSYFTFGPIGMDGRVVAKIIYDHRVLDGRVVARCLNDLERVLNTEIVDELRKTRPGDATPNARRMAVSEDLGGIEQEAKAPTAPSLARAVPLRPR